MAIVFNAEAVRDALGLVRLLWLTEKGGGGAFDDDRFREHLKRMDLLTEVGETLGQCLKMGRLDPDTIGYRAAVHRSADALERLASATFNPLVQLARDRVTRGHPKAKTESDHKRDVRRLRGGG